MGVKTYKKRIASEEAILCFGNRRLLSGDFCFTFDNVEISINKFSVFNDFNYDSVNIITIKVKYFVCCYFVVDGMFFELNRPFAFVRTILNLSD
ncbi:hypothetical protein D3C78_1369610 [compost metagenome]